MEEIAPALAKHLSSCDTEFEIISHPRIVPTSIVAEVNHIKGRNLAKGAVLETKTGELILGVIPSMNRVNFTALNALVGDQYHMAPLESVTEIFHDCEFGAIPVLGEPYGVRTIFDEALYDIGPIHFKAGNHSNLIKMRGRAFKACTLKNEKASISLPPN